MSSNVPGSGSTEAQHAPLGLLIHPSVTEPSAPSHGRKRPRTDDDLGLEDNPETQKPVIQRRHPDLWFSDGNIILVAEGTGFKVYKGILASQSEVFRDMFALAQPGFSVSANGEESTEGAPIVLLGDHANEVAYFLRPLFASGTTQYMNPLIPMSIEVISAFFKLGDKYAMTHLRDEALRRLKETYTGNYEDWASRRSAGRQAIDPLSPPGRAIVAINLARTFGLDYLLPVAFYECAQLSPKILVRGVTFSNGHVERLSEDDLELCLVGRQKLVERHSFMLLRIFSVTCSDSSKNCSRDRCPSGAISRISSDILNAGTWRKNCNDESVKCIRCIVERLNHSERLLKFTYDGLGKCFALPGEPHLHC